MPLWMNEQGFVISDERPILPQLNYVTGQEEADDPPLLLTAMVGVDCADLLAEVPQLIHHDEMTFRLARKGHPQSSCTRFLCGKEIRSSSNGRIGPWAPINTTCDASYVPSTSSHSYKHRGKDPEEVRVSKGGPPEGQGAGSNKERCLVCGRPHTIGGADETGLSSACATQILLWK